MLLTVVWGRQVWKVTYVAAWGMYACLCMAGKTKPQYTELHEYVLIEIYIDYGGSGINSPDVSTSHPAVISCCRHQKGTSI